MYLIFLGAGPPGHISNYWLSSIIKNRKKKQKKKHDCVSCGLSSRCATPWVVYRQEDRESFSHLSISVIPYPSRTKFSAQMPSRYGSPHSRFEGNRLRKFREMSSQNFGFFDCFFFSYSSSSCIRTLVKSKNWYKT